MPGSRCNATASPAPCCANACFADCAQSEATAPSTGACNCVPRGCCGVLQVFIIGPASELQPHRSAVAPTSSKRSQSSAWFVHIANWVETLQHVAACTAKHKTKCIAAHTAYTHTAHGSQAWVFRFTAADALGLHWGLRAHGICSRGPNTVAQKQLAKTHTRKHLGD